MLGRKKLILRMCMVMLCTVIVSASCIVSSQAMAASYSKQQKQVKTLVNKQRSKRKLGTLKLDAKLCKAAQKRAKELTKTFSHTRPDGSSCFTVLQEYNATYMVCGENIAAGQTTAKQVMDSWMHSAGHKANILNKSYKKIGVGYYKKSSSDYHYYWVQIFSD